MAEQGTQLGIKTVMYGEQWRDMNGSLQIAPEDIVVITTLIGGEPESQVMLNPDQSFTVATTLARAAGDLMGAQVNDKGQRAGLLGFFTRTLGAKA